MNESVVKIENLSKRYNHTLALNDVSVTIQRGRIYGFIGQNGAGKTTLLRKCYRGSCYRGSEVL